MRDDNVMTWKRFPHYRPFVEESTNGFSSQSPNDMDILCFPYCELEQAVEQKIEWPIECGLKRFNAHAMLV